MNPEVSKVGVYLGFLYSLVDAGEKLPVLLVCDKGSAMFHLRNEVHA